jgi:hypothetical protein
MWFLMGLLTAKLPVQISQFAFTSLYSAIYDAFPNSAVQVAPPGVFTGWMPEAELKASDRLRRWRFKA